MNSDFEKRLQTQPLKQIPTEWREEILRNAETASVSRQRLPETRHLSWWKELLWPCPQAWAALAAVWLVLAVLHFASAPKNPVMAKKQSPSTGWVASLREQERVITEVISAAEPREADRPKRLPPSSQYRRKELIIV